MSRTALLATIALVAASVVPAVALAPADARPAPKPKVVAAPVTVAENAGKAVVQVTLSKKAKKAVKVGWLTKDGTATAGTDYTKSAGTLTIKKGKKTGAITVPVLDDAVHEQAETFTVTLASKQAKAAAPVSVTITDNDTAPGPGGPTGQPTPPPPSAPSALVGTITLQRSMAMPTGSITQVLNVHLVPTTTPGEWRDSGTGTWTLSGTDMMPGAFATCTASWTTDFTAAGNFLTGPGEPAPGQATLALTGFDPATGVGSPTLSWQSKSSASRTTQIPTMDILPPLFIPMPGCISSTSNMEYLSTLTPGATGTYTGSASRTRGVNFAYTGTIGADLVSVTGTLTPMP